MAVSVKEFKESGKSVFHVLVNGEKSGKFAFSHGKASTIASRMGGTMKAVASAPRAVAPVCHVAVRRAVRAPVEEDEDEIEYQAEIEEGDDDLVPVRRGRPAGQIEVSQSRAALRAADIPRRPSRGAPGGVMLAHVWNESDPTGWWMSEKHDGMRAYWTGSELYTRENNPIHAPKWFTDALPPIALDGELTLGRGTLQRTVSVARKDHPIDSEWRRIQYNLFDGPELRGGFEQRIEALKRAVASSGASFLTVLDQTRCTGEAHLQRYMQAIVAGGGEGAMLRGPGSAYERRRSHQLLKVKPYLDTEARITGYEPGKGKHLGRLGAYWAVLLKGSKLPFKIGTGMSDAQRERPLAVGTVVTIKYNGLSDDGKPRTASFLRVHRS